MSNEIKPLSESASDTRLNARVHKIKRSGRIVFVYLCAGGEIIKTVYRPDWCEKDISGLNAGMFLRAAVSEAPEQKAENGIELRLRDFEILSSPAAPYPLSISGADCNYSLETAAEYKALILRHPHIAAVYKVQSRLLFAFEEFMEKNGFFRVTAPVISSFSEKPSFELDYFGARAVLSHTPQLYMTAATAAFDKTYSVSPSFLAKKYNSSRHMNEFTSLNFQLGYIDTVDDVINMTSALLDYMTKAVPEAGISTEIPVYAFDDALKMLGKNSQPDLDPTDIKNICSREKRNGFDFVCVKGFPPDKRPFYAEDYENFDIYLNGSKIASGSKNFSDYAAQRKKADRLNIMLKRYKAYDDALKYGIMPYGCLTLGLERLTAALMRLENVKYASLFPRDLHHIEP